jgi:3-deoxy-D-manno-octulosonate 8-phosphate phosphatase (KDO 8-P phosphatase)
MLLLDVDGVMTDGGIILIGRTEESKRFDVHDGLGVTLARCAGLKVGIITGRKSDVVQRRAEELGIDELLQGIGRKTEALKHLLAKHEIDAAQVAYIGDDLPDLRVMEKVGMPIAVENAVPAIKEISVYVTKAAGGHGAVREAVEWVLDLRGNSHQVYKQITG